MTDTQPASPPPATRSLASRVYAILLLVIGLWLTVGGIYLLSLGGSPYYFFAGLAVAISGALVWRGDRNGARLYGAMLIGTLAWSLWEAGIDGWPLMPRVVAPTVLGLGFLLPPIRRGLTLHNAEPKSWQGL